MTKDTIKMAQEYLTFDCMKILDIEALSKRHPLTKIICLLETLMKDKKETLKDLIVLEITSREIDRTISEWFRIELALNVLREEVRYEESKAEQGTEKSRRSA